MQNALGNLGSRIQSTFRYPDGALVNLLAMGYTMAGYIGGLFLLITGSGWMVPGIILLTHSLVIAAYLLHECTHGSLFRAPRDGKTDFHQPLAVVLTWLTGACYGDLGKIKEKHLRHHFERADISVLDYRHILADRPRLKQLVELGQRCYLPAVEILMHTLVLIRPFVGGGSIKTRFRVLVVAVIRLLFFLWLWRVGGFLAVAGYGIAYLIFLTVLNFMDAFQHQYLLLDGLDAERGQSPTRDKNRFPGNYFSRDYENSHTWSNLISERWPTLNLLLLNFPYHNIHHQQPMEPWYRLPELHRQQTQMASSGVQTVPFRTQLRDFFRYRVERVMAPAIDDTGSLNIGAAGVSFLTPL